MHEQSGTLNGATTLYLVLGELRSDVNTIKTDMRDVKQHLALLAIRRQFNLGDLTPFVVGLAVLVLAAAEKWGPLGQFLQGFAR